MVKFGVLEALFSHPEGLTQEEIAQQTQLSPYAGQVLLEASLSIGIVIVQQERSLLS